MHPLHADGPVTSGSFASAARKTTVGPVDAEQRRQEAQSANRSPDTRSYAIT